MKSSPSSLARETACIGSTLLPHSDTLQPAALRGTALHAYLCAVAKGVGVDIARLMLPEEWQEAAGQIDLEQLPDLDPESGVPELAIAWDVATGEARELARGGTLTRDQVRALARESEFVGILDWVALTDDGVVVVDYKSGHTAVDPAETNSQLAACAVLAAKLFRRDRAHVGITRLLGNGDVWRNTATLDALDLDGAEAQLRQHLRRVDEHAESYRSNGVMPKLVEGGHCRYCPAFRYCPAKAALARSILSPDGAAPAALARLPMPLTNEAAAELWPQLAAASDLVAKLQQNIRDLAANQGGIVLANGNVLAEVEHAKSSVDPERLKEVDPEVYAATVKRKESVTKESVEAHLKATKPAGAKLAPIARAFFERLDEAGAMRHTAYRSVDEVAPTSKKLVAKT